MKVAILTLRFHSNFGFIMQAYAMQNVIRKLGHDPVSYYTKIEETPVINKIKQTIKNVIKKVTKGSKEPVFWYWPTKEDYEIIDKHTNEFIRDNIVLTPYLKGFREIENYDNDKFDAFIVGSDQVWRASFSLNIPTYFFRYLSESRKKMAYAASFGIPQLDYTKKEIEECGKLLSSFKIVTVREDDAVDICNKEFGVNAVSVLDPTLLLPKEEYYEMAEKGNLLNEGRPYIFAYILESTPHIEEYIKKIEKMYHLPVVNILPPNYEFSSKKQIESLIYPPIYDILRGFRDAEFIITDSFHGTAFSINLNKKFSVFIHKHRGSSRIPSILKNFEITKRVESYDFSDGIINFDNVNRILEEKRNYAIKLLKDFFDE